MKEQHFVTFYSPGTFVAEDTTKPVDSWSVEIAVKMAKQIKERYGARLYGFQFTTRRRRNDELDSREVKRSGMYYLNGTVETLADIEAKHDADNRTLISNMRSNRWNRVVTTRNGYRWTQPFHDEDFVVDSKTATVLFSGKAKP